tara:strand:+ start:14368 stop:15048 length:681 start_codon:yes stop_codon:yes gene_type:complete
MINILLTGSEGFIGKNLKKYLKKNYNIFELDLNSTPPVDATDEEQVKQFIKGKNINIILNCVGIPDAVPLKAESILDIDTNYFKKMIDINLNSIFIICKEAYRECKSSLTHIINISSLYSIVSPRLDLYNGKIKNPAYTASKHGLIGLTKHLAVLFGKDDITVNCIAPAAVVDTISDNDFLEKYNKQVPLGRGVTIKDIYKSVIYLVDNQNITGQNLIIDGGYTCL